MDSYERFARALDFGPGHVLPSYDMINNTKIHEKFGVVFLEQQPSNTIVRTPTTFFLKSA